MSDLKQATKEDIEKVQQLFGLAHDMIAQATFPGHVHAKVQEVMAFLAYQYNDFKARAEALPKVTPDQKGEAIPVVSTPVVETPQQA